MTLSLTYEDTKRLARDGSTAERFAIASHSETQPEILYYLADDPDSQVRQCIAANVQTPNQADLLLARDDDTDVRCALASKIGRLFPQVPEADQDSLRHAVLDIVEVLASDQTSRVRAVISEALKDVAEVPHDLILQLANDEAQPVCLPVLEFSPVLTNNDLLSLVLSAPVQGALSAISRRATVDEQVADAIAESNNQDAITSLLANKSAQIREETLDKLIDEATGVVAWHDPLVQRPELPEGPAKKIASFVAQSLLEKLRARTDLAPKTLDAVEAAVASRLEDDNLDTPSTESEKWTAPLSRQQKAARQRAIELHRTGTLDNRSICRAMTQGDKHFILTALSLLSTIDEETVGNIFDQESSKGIVALCWKSRLGMDIAMQMQFTIGKITPTNVIRTKGTDKFPMTPEEMNWQIEFFENQADKFPRTAVH